MKPADNIPPESASRRGTLHDYSNDPYLVYFEVGEHDNKAREIIESWLTEEGKAGLQAVPDGYIVAIPIQVTPEIVRGLSAANIAVYQVQRYAKL